METNINFKKNFVWNVLGTGLNAFNSLFLMIIVTRINGVDKAGIFTIAFSTACILYVIGTFAGRIFQVTEGDKTISDKDFIVNRILSFILMILCTIAFVVIRKYDYYKSTIFIILAIYKGIEAFSDVLYGIMQKNDLLYKAGQSYFLKGLLTLFVFFTVDFFTKDLVMSCVSIVIIWLVIMVVFDLRTVHKLIDTEKRMNWKNTIKLFKTGFFVFSITFLGLYVMNAPKYAIDSMLENKYQTIFGIIVMPATVIGLFGQFLIHPYLNQFVKLNESKDYNEIKKLQMKLIIYILIFGVVASIGAYFLGIPVLQLIYGIDLQDYNIALTIIIIASTLYNVGMIYSNVLTTMRHTFIQFILYIVTAITAFAISNIFTNTWGVKGASIAYFIIMLELFGLYFVTEKIILTRKGKE